MTIINELCNSTIQWKHIQCELNIKVTRSTSVNHKNTDLKRDYYDISYIWNYDRSTVKHPMFDDKEYIESHSDGEIVVANEITTALISALVLNNNDLEKISGHIDADCYRCTILKALSLFWD